MSERRTNSAAYVDFFILFVAPVVGKKRFENLCWRQKLSDFVTISDEALALVLFQNNYDRWMAMGEKKSWSKSDVHPKYTTGGNAVQTPKLDSDENKNEVPNDTAVVIDSRISTCA